MTIRLAYLGEGEPSTCGLQDGSGIVSPPITQCAD
jgi:hypothetical protein